MANGQGAPGVAAILTAESGVTDPDGAAILGSGIRLPVAPLDEVRRSVTANTNQFLLVKTGSVVNVGGPGLMQVSFESLIPEFYGEDRFVHPGVSYEAASLADAMYTLAAIGSVMRLVIASYDTAGSAPTAGFVNILCLISSWEDAVQEGDARYFNVTFNEWRPVQVRRVTRATPRTTSSSNNTARSGSTGSTSTGNSGNPGRAGSKTIPRRITLTASSGSMQDVARLYYGDPSLYKLIVAANPKINNGVGWVIGQSYVIPPKPTK